MLRRWEGELRRANAAGTQEAFELLRGQFQTLADDREKAQQTASAALEAAFDFMEQAFAESQDHRKAALQQELAAEQRRHGGV